MSSGETCRNQVIFTGAPLVSYITLCCVRRQTPLA
jgi:hypothetical protein